MRKTPYALSSTPTKHRPAVAVLKYRVVDLEETGAAGQCSAATAGDRGEVAILDLEAAGR